MLTTGSVLQNRYRIVTQLGQGGMGAVYRAWDMRLNVPVAVKEMLPQVGLSPQILTQLRQQFHQEATILARLTHPNLVRVTDFFEEGENAYLVMDFVEGESLASYIHKRGALPESEVLTWAGQLLSALAYCHKQGIIHRDIKPQNVIIRSDGEAVLVDFGLVKLWDPNDPRTKTVMRGMGTPEYAPPEQYEADSGHTDPRSDIYSLGATLYHALAGQSPLTATLRMASPERFVSLRAVNPSVTPATEAAVMKALELARSNRWQSAGEMAAALRVGGAAAPAVTPAAPPREKTEVLPGAQATAAPPVAVSAPTARKRPWLLIVGIALLAVLCVCGGGLWLFRKAVKAGQVSMTATAVAQATALEAAWTTQVAATAQADSATATAQAVAAAATATAQAIAPTATPKSVRPTIAPRPPASQDCPHDDTLVPAGWGLVWCDPFDSLQHDWYTGDYDDTLVTGKKEIVDGVYRWTATAHGGVTWWGVPEMDDLADFYLTVQIRQVSGAKDAQYGVIFNQSDNSNYGYFKIDDSGRYKFIILSDGEWFTVLDWTETTAVAPGETNRLTVVAEDGYYTFYINDEYVDTAYEERLSAGQAGVAIELLAANDKGVFEFDNFEVWAP